MCAIEPGSPLQLLVAQLFCLFYMLLVLYAGPYKGNFEDTLAFLTSLCLTVSLLLGLCLIMDDPTNVIFPLTTVGIVLIVINVVPFLYFLFASAIIIKHGPLTGMHLGASTPENQKEMVLPKIKGPSGRNERISGQRRQQRKLQNSITLANVQKVVAIDKVERIQNLHAMHLKTAISNILMRRKTANERVRKRLRERRAKKRHKNSETIKAQTTKVLSTPSNVDPATAAVLATAAAYHAEFETKKISKEEINIVRCQLQKKIGTEDRLNVIIGRLEKGRNQMLSPREFKKLIHAADIKPPVTKAVIKAMWIDACHLRKDGSIQELDLVTLKSWILFKD